MILEKVNYLYKYCYALNLRIWKGLQGSTPNKYTKDLTKLGLQIWLRSNTETGLHRIHCMSFQEKHCRAQCAR